MILKALTRKSHAWNEDRFICGDNYWIVIDGATPLIKAKGKNLARYMVSYVKKHIGKYDGRIKDRLIKLSKDMYDELNLSINDPAYLPSASVSYVELIDDVFHVGILGDCEVTFRLVNREIIRCHTTELSKLDEISLNELIKVSKEKNISIREGRKYIEETLKKHRRLINKEDGYQAYTLSNNLTFNEYTFSIEKDKVSEMYLYSDGFSMAFQQLKIYQNHEEMFQTTLDIDFEVQNIVNRAFLDSNCNMYPRFKKIDDITIIQYIV